jgi:hypothetical protein
MITEMVEYAAKHCEEKLKKCTKCDKEKPESEFHANRPDCKDCRHVASGAKKRFVTVARVLGAEKRCTSCGVVMEIREFHKNCSRCKFCKGKVDKAYYLANKDKCISATMKWKANNPEKVSGYNQKRGEKDDRLKRVLSNFSGR